MHFIYKNKCFFLVFLLPLLTACAPLVAVGVGTGAGTTAMVTEDRRTSGIFIEDESIELKSSRDAFMNNWAISFMST